MPRLGRVASNDREASRDEPFAWDSREFLRKKVIGKRVNFTIDNTTPTGNFQLFSLYIPVLIDEQNFQN